MDGTASFLHHFPEHWHTTGLCVESNSLFSPHSSLCTCIHHQHHCKICKGTSDWADFQQCWVSLLSGDTKSGGMVLSERPVPQHSEDQRAHCRLQKITGWGLLSSLYQQRQWGACIKFQVLQGKHFWEPLMENQHHSTDEESKTTAVSPENVKKKPAFPSRCCLDLTHLCHNLSELLPSSRGYRAFHARPQDSEPVSSQKP